MDSPGEESFFPQVSGRSSSPSFQAVYWRAIGVLFASSVKNNPDARHVFFCNSVPPNTKTVPLLDLFRKFAVEIIVVPFTYRGAVEATRSFGNVLYIFDVIKYISEHIDAERVIILDPDCLWIRSAKSLEAMIDRHGAVFYDIGYPPEKDNNGLTRLQLQQIAGEFLANPAIEPPPFVGGELYAATAKENKRVAALIDRFVARNTELRAQGASSLVTEEHFFSLIAFQLGYDTKVASSFIKRIWTAFRFRNSQRADLSLTIWHLPSEKRTGLAVLFRDLVSKKTKFWSVPAGEPFAHYVGRFCGIPKRSSSKLVSDALDRLRARLKLV
jgi:hypothetical protein